MVYCVDLRDKITGDTLMTIFRSNDYDAVWDVANNYNYIHGITEHEFVLLENGETEGWTPHPYWASVQNDCEEIIELEEKKMKKYTLKDYKEFCKKAFIMPPLDDEENLQEWFDTHKIHITANDCVMELEYDADAVSELECSLEEIYDIILGDGQELFGEEN